MGSIVFNSSADIGNAGGGEQEKMLPLLAASLWRIEADAENKRWVVIEDNSAISRFGLTRADFPGAVPPVAPEWVDPPRIVPSSITRRQAKQALLKEGLLESVQNLMLNPATPQEYVIDWNDADSFERGSSTVSAIAAALSLSDTQVDDLFVAAAAI
jgi:hypothetical protein